ncbi:MAG: hypothetical protein RLZZ342_666 [Candidatus Parcubacteria bacterium]|jgi:hypothetical protein
MTHRKQLLAPESIGAITRPRLMQVVEGFVRVPDGRVFWVTKTNGVTNLHPVFDDKTVCRKPTDDEENLNQQVWLVDARKLGIDKAVWAKL